MSDDPTLRALLAWCATVLGPCEAPGLRARPDGRSATTRIVTATGAAYLKTHSERANWEIEVRAYERWAPALGARAPRLMAAREEPYALLLSVVPGRPMREAALSPAQEAAAWRDAGIALRALHDLPAGQHFGPEGDAGLTEAPAYALADLDRWVNPGLRAGSLTDEDLAVVESARALAPAFCGERPVACHRDYNLYNWLVDEAGEWCGVIDFEFCYPDVRVAEFTRYPEWEWWRRPELVAALREGYGLVSGPREEEQMLLSHVIYSVSMIVWGQENGYLGCVAEGREALRHLRHRLT
jgi:aminoglycoside phosphotransferase (APT) family kinase protein